MVCKSLQTYITFFIFQIFFRFLLFGGGAELALHILGVVPLSVILYLLCSYKYFNVANTIVGLCILMGIYADIFMATHRSQLKKMVHGNFAGLPSL